MSHPHTPKTYTPEWKQLGDILDMIYRSTDDAIHKGYCCKKGKALDESLAVIIQSAEEARRILRL